MDFRIEKDSLGDVKVPAGAYWGSQAERTRNDDEDRDEDPRGHLRCRATSVHLSLKLRVHAKAGDSAWASEPIPCHSAGTFRITRAESSSIEPAGKR